MATIVASNGTTYHLWELPAASYPELEDTIEFATLDNDLLDGYRSGVLCGFSAGTRSWKLTMPTLASLEALPAAVNGARGGLMSRDLYVRTLYAENKVSGQPFVFRWDSVNYFVDFADEALSLQRMRVKIFTTGLTIRQRRLSGVTV